MTKIWLTEHDLQSNYEECVCGNKAEMRCISEGKYNSSMDSDDYWWYISNYKILRCPACYQIIIFEYTTSLNDQIEEKNKANNNPYLEYKRRILFSPAKPRHYSIPSSISEVISEAEKVLPTSPRAAAILCRATLEEICRDKGIPDKKLKQSKDYYLFLKEKIKLLIQQENLSEELKTLLTGVRIIGNTATHDSHMLITKKISYEDAEILISLVDYIINRLYVDKALSEKTLNELTKIKRKIENQKEESND